MVEDGLSSRSRRAASLILSSSTLASNGSFHRLAFPLPPRSLACNFCSQPSSAFSATTGW